MGRWQNAQDSDGYYLYFILLIMYYNFHAIFKMQLSKYSGMSLKVDSWKIVSELREGFLLNMLYIKWTSHLFLHYRETTV